MPKDVGKVGGLTHRERLFVKEFARDYSITQAAKRAGYNNPSSSGNDLMAKPRVMAAIEREFGARVSRLEISADKVLQELAKLAFSNMADYTVTNEDGDLVPALGNCTRDQMAAITELQVEEYKEGRGEDARTVKRTKFKLGAKRDALRDLGQHLGLFTERVQLTGPGGGPVQTVISSMTPEQAAEAYAATLAAPISALAATARASAVEAEVEEDDQ